MRSYQGERISPPKGLSAKDMAPNVPVYPDVPRPSRKKICSNCGAEIKEKDAFCSECGKKQVKYCPNCGGEVLPTDISCRDCGEDVSFLFQSNRTREAEPAPTYSYINVSDPSSSSRVCPKCGKTMNVQTISEGKKAGCLTVLLYILLAITVVGILIIIPLALRKKDELHTYAVCQSCGYRKKLK